MNIFVTDISPILSAQALDDKRVVKMALESAQLLSTAIYLDTGHHYKKLYKPTHVKHPCALWAAETIENWHWLEAHFHALCDEYHFRYDKTHKSSELYTPLSQLSEKAIPPGERTPFPNCTRAPKLGIDYRGVEDVFEAYRAYLKARWEHDVIEPKWTRRGKPEWYEG